MKTRPSSFRRGFTLVEMLAVISIIVVLAGIVMASTVYVKQKRALSEAKVQVSLLSNSIEEYKTDVGYYPPGGSGGKGDSKILYRALYWDSNDNGAGADTDTVQKIYLSELDPKNNKMGWTEGNKAEVIIIDPWGNEYRYRSGKLDDGSANPKAVNPDFDLWSAGPDGKTSDSDDNEYTKDDIRNW
jgi:general secretion pathway protein G